MALEDFLKMFNKDFGTGEFLQEESNKNSLFVSSLKTIGRSLVSFVTEPIAGVVNFFAQGKGDAIRDSVYSYVGSKTLLKSDKTKMENIETWVDSLLVFCFGLNRLVASPFYDIYDGVRKFFFPKGYQEYLDDLDKKAMVQKLCNFEKNFFVDFYSNNDFFERVIKHSYFDTIEEISVEDKNKIPKIKQKINELIEEWKQIETYFQAGYCVPDRNEQKVHKEHIRELKQLFEKVLYAIKSADNSIDVSQISNDISSIDENVIVVKSGGKDGNVKKQPGLETIKEEINGESNYSKLENKNKNINDIDNSQNFSNFNDQNINNNDNSYFENSDKNNKSSYGSLKEIKIDFNISNESNDNINDILNNINNISNEKIINNNNLKNKDNNIDDNGNINDESNDKLTILKNIEYDDNDENDGKKIHSIVNLKNKNDEISNNNNFSNDNLESQNSFNKNINNSNSFG